MRELEREIKEWRRAMRAELPPRTVRELETHLWEHIAAMRGEGVSAEAAFDRAAERLGEPRALGNEFARLSVPWLPASWSVRGVLVLVGGLSAVMVVWSAMRVLAGVDKAWFAAHYLSVSCGYFVVFGMGLISIRALMAGWRRPLARWQRTELRQALFRMIAISAVLLPAGTALGFVWRGQPEAWHWTEDSLRLGMLLFGSTSLLLYAMSAVKRWSGSALPWLFTMAIYVAQFVWYGLDARSAAVPSGWLVLSLFFTQAALVRLNYRRRGLPQGAP